MAHSSLPVSEPSVLEPEGGSHGEVELLHVDDSVIVAVKPSGLLAVPGRGADKHDCLAARMQARYADALVVHRLDMATSGLIVMARSPHAQRALSKAFAAREVSKRYVAVVAGRLARPIEEWETIDLPIIVDWPNRPRRIVDSSRGKPSRTRWRVLDDGARACTRVELEPVTGRSHQLRVHLCALGHPILGDALYAPESVRAQANRLLLHATALAFVHPTTGAVMRFDSAPPF